MFWSRAQGSAYEKLTLIFEMYDLNGSGVIDFNELHIIVKTLLKLKYNEFSKSDEDLELVDKKFSQFQKIIFQDQTLLNSKLPLSYNIAMYIMRRLDTSRKAKLNKEEFVNGCLNSENIRKFLTPLKIF